MLGLSAAMPVEMDSVRYNMNHKHRGKCIVFNHENFDTGLGKRNGTKQDAKRIENTFKNLGFYVQVLDDLEHLQIIEKITSRNDKITFLFSFLIFILNTGILINYYFFFFV